MTSFRIDPSRDPVELVSNEVRSFFEDAPYEIIFPEPNQIIANTHPMICDPGVFENALRTLEIRSVKLFSPCAFNYQLNRVMDSDASMKFRHLMLVDAFLKVNYSITPVEMMLWIITKDMEALRKFVATVGMPLGASLVSYAASIGYNNDVRVHDIIIALLSIGRIPNYLETAAPNMFAQLCVLTPPPTVDRDWAKTYFTLLRQLSDGIKLEW